MLTSVICRRNNQGRNEAGPFRQAGGFTIMELLLVMTILGLLAGMALPRVEVLYRSFSWASERDEVLRSIADLGLIASREGKAFDLIRYPDSSGHLPLHLPDDWQIRARLPIHYRDNGVCTGGELSLQYKGRKMKLELKPPFCQPEIQWN